MVPSRQSRLRALLVIVPFALVILLGTVLATEAASKDVPEKVRREPLRQDIFLCLSGESQAIVLLLSPRLLNRPQILAELLGDNRYLYYAKSRSGKNLHRSVMELYAKQGEIAKARAQYEACGSLIIGDF
jgi:hypothetical protein